METIRKPFQGVTNIIRFNRHFYVLFALLFCFLIIARGFVPAGTATFITVFILLMTLSTFISVAVSFYIYDRSNLYRLNWLDDLNISAGGIDLVNINAGLDETSAQLAKKYPAAHLTVFDFYAPAKHTEVSIKRARKAYPPYPGTQPMTTTGVAIKPNSIDYIFAILAAHEVRDRKERIDFFKALGKSLKTEGKIVVVEHLRNMPNFIAYNIGFLHFFSRTEWQNTFNSAGLAIIDELRITLYIRVFILQ